MSRNNVKKPGKIAKNQKKRKSGKSSEKQQRRGKLNIIRCSQDFGAMIKAII
jgi:hypothetical protein